jgi:hypothetical protein
MTLLAWGARELDVFVGETLSRLDGQFISRRHGEREYNHGTWQGSVRKSVK